MTLSARYLALAAAMGAALQPALARAALPQPVRAMIEAAIATGDETKVATVVAIARQTQPGGAAEIDALNDAFLADLAVKKAAAEQRQREEVRSAGFFDTWEGKGEIGAYQSSGNSDNVGVSVALNLERRGIDWQHKFRASADYQRSTGQTSREQYLVSYEPRYKASDHLFLFALAQFERDKLQGLSSRYALSGGIGHDVIDTERLRLSIKAGPAFRHTRFTDGTVESRLGGLAGVDLNWEINERLTLTQDTNMVAETGGRATVIIESGNTSLHAVTGLDMKVSGRLTTRLSYTIDYDSNPPVGKVSTDTLSRFTLVYGF